MLASAEVLRVDKPAFDRILMSNATPGAAIQEQHMLELAPGDVDCSHQSNNQVPYSTSSQHGGVAGSMGVNVDVDLQDDMMTVIITLQTHQLPMTQIVDGVIANALNPIQCNYKQQFGERVQELLDPAIDPRERGHLRVAFTLMCVFSFV